MCPAQIRRALSLFALPLLFASTLQAQNCPGADLREPDNDCATTPLETAPATFSNLTAEAMDEDWTRWIVQPGDTLRLDALFVHASGDIDLSLFGDCGTFLGFSFTATDNERIDYVNTETTPVEVRLQVTLAPGGTCNDYTLQATVIPPPPCFSGNDAAEPNDSCSTAPLLADGLTSGLSLSPIDEDWFALDLVPGDEYLIDALFTHAEGDIDLELYGSGAGDCSYLIDSSTSGSDNEQVLVRNVSNVPVRVTLRVFAQGALCTDYMLTSVHNLIGDPCNSLLDDIFEPNDAPCDPLLPTLPVGTYSGLRVLSPNLDHYRFSVPPGMELVCDLLFSHAQGDLQLSATTGPSCLASGISSTSTTDDERIVVPNTSGQALTARVRAWLNPAAPGLNTSCNDYTLATSLRPLSQTNLVPFCFGDGSGTACPCMNEDGANPATGGCNNATGRGAQLVAQGNPSVAMDTLRFDIQFAPPSTFGVLISGPNELGGSNGIPAFDGLRCVGGGILRQGTRGIGASGTNGNPWGFGAGPPGGLIAQAGYQAGQRRSFQVFYRTMPTTACGSGQNTTNAIRVDFLP